MLSRPGYDGGAGNQGGNGGGYPGYSPDGGAGFTAPLGSDPRPSGALGPAAASTADWAFYLDYAPTGDAQPPDGIVGADGPRRGVGRSRAKGK